MFTFFVMSSRSIFMVAIYSAKISWLSSRSCGFLGWVTVGDLFLGVGTRRLAILSRAPSGSNPLTSLTSL